APSAVATMNLHREDGTDAVIVDLLTEADVRAEVKARPGRSGLLGKDVRLFLPVDHFSAPGRFPNRLGNRSSRFDLRTVLHAAVGQELRADGLQLLPETSAVITCREIILIIREVEQLARPRGRHRGVELLADRVDQADLGDHLLRLARGESR